MARLRTPRKRSEGNETALLHEREFVSPQVRVQMDCRRDETTIKANFSRPFQGIMGVGNLATTKCKLTGSGEQYYELHVAHNATDSCDARWDNATSSIANTLVIRFHQSLETGADIAKNTLCRLAVGNLVVGRRPSQLKKPPRSSRSAATNDTRHQVETGLAAGAASGDKGPRRFWRPVANRNGAARRNVSGLTVDLK